MNTHEGTIMNTKAARVLTLEEIDYIEKIGRDYRNNRMTIGLPEIDALCYTARRGVRAMNGMDPGEYQRLAGRTECDQVKARGRMCGMVVSPPYGDLLAIRLNHAVIGLAGEIGELASAVEKAVYYGKGMSYVTGPNLIEELGDVMWYVAEACNASGLSLGAVMEANIAKLKERYPDRYTDERAAEENRDRAAEAEALKKVVAEHSDGPWRILPRRQTAEAVALAVLVRDQIMGYKCRLEAAGCESFINIDLLLSGARAVLGDGLAELASEEIGRRFLNVGAVESEGSEPAKEGEKKTPHQSQEEAIREVPGGPERLDRAGHKAPETPEPRRNYGASSDSDNDAE